jgi:hypothetical protein
MSFLGGFENNAQMGNMSSSDKHGLSDVKVRSMLLFAFVPQVVPVDSNKL